MATGPGLAMKMTADTVGISRGVTRTEKLLGVTHKKHTASNSGMRGLVAIEVGKIVGRRLCSCDIGYWPLCVGHPQNH
jgi:hypothetical protein